MKQLAQCHIFFDHALVNIRQLYYVHLPTRFYFFSNQSLLLHLLDWLPERTINQRKGSRYVLNDSSCGKCQSLCGSDLSNFWQRWKRRHRFQGIYDYTYDTGCPTWIATKVNECCDYVFRVRHFSLQIYAGKMCTFWFFKGSPMIWGIFLLEK